MQQSPNQRPPAGRRIAGRAQDAAERDPYHPRRRPAGPVVCPQCGVLFADGRWHWGNAPAGAKSEPCPACRRIKDDLPAGIVTLHVAAGQPRRDEVITLARHREEAERSEHPLNRIMRVEETPEAVVITTTDIHLPRRIGEAMERAFRGELEMAFDENSYFVRVDWRPAAH